MTIRQSILMSSIGFAVALILFVIWTSPLSNLSTVKISQYTSLISLVYLYISLIISPIFTIWTEFPYKAVVKRARRSIGVSGFLFAAIHGLVSFFGQLSGFRGLSFLTRPYLTAVILGTGALLILLLMTVTSTDSALRRLGFLRWKSLHRLVYISTLFTVIHALMLGTHFRNLSDLIPTLFVFCLSLLLLLEWNRFLIFLCKNPVVPAILRICTALCILMFSIFLTMLLQSFPNRLSVHPEHQEDTEHEMVRHDSAIDYMLLPETPVVLEANVPLPLRLQVLDWQTRTPLESFLLTHHKSMHLVITDATLDWFLHTHPVRNGPRFEDEVIFPKKGSYYLYATVAPEEVGDLTLTTTLRVDQDNAKSQASPPPNTIIASMVSPKKLSMAKLQEGSASIDFRVQDIKTKKTIAQMQEYLESLGHLVMIHKESLDYIHVHPTLSKDSYDHLPEDAKIIPFKLPVGHEGLKPGSYRLFVEFAADGRVQSQKFDLELY